MGAVQTTAALTQASPLQVGGLLIGEGGPAPVGVRRAAVAQLGHTLGNRALTALVARRASRGTVQREDEPADVAAQTAFNPMDIMHKLLIAIDQSDVNLFKPKPTRHVNFDAVVSALSNLTRHEADTVKAAYGEHEQRKLTTDLFEGGESGFPTDLNESQKGQIHALLAGTRAMEGASEAEQQGAATHLAVTKAREVERLLKGKASKANVEKVMVILRQPKEANMALLAAYSRFGGMLYVDLARTDQSPRADLLLEGKTVEADALKVSSEQKGIEKLDIEIAKLEARNAPKELSIQSLMTARSPIEQYTDEVQLKKLRGERKKLADDIEARGEQTIAEAHKEGADAKARIEAVYGGTGESVAATVGGTSAAVIRAIGKDDPATRIAAELRRSASDGKLTGPQLTAAIRSLRAEARAQAERELGRGHPGLDAHESAIADRYFATLRSAYDQFTAGDPKAKKFVDIINETGGEGDEALNKELYVSAGKLEDVRELVLALRGSRKDMAAVERVLRDKSAKEIRDLIAAYADMAPGHTLEQDLFGEGGMTGQQIPESMRGLMGLGTDVIGKASGTARLNLEDYLQRPDKVDGPADVRYILARAEREYRYTIDNRGATGWWRDTWGNEQRSLLDGTIRDLRIMVVQYRRMVGWKDTTSEVVLYPDAVESSDVRKLVQDMRLARHTIRGDRAAYEEATAKLRATFEAIASFVLQAVLTAVLTPAAAALFRVAQGSAQALLLANRVRQFAATVAAGTLSNVGSTVVVTGDYSVAQLRNALVSNLTGPLGSGAAAKLMNAGVFTHVAKGIVDRLGPGASAQLREFVKSNASNITSTAAVGDSLSEALSVEGMLKARLMDVGGEKIGGLTTKMTGLDTPAGGTETPPPGGESVPAGGTGEQPSATTPPETAPAKPPGSEGEPPPVREEEPAPANGGGGGGGPGLAGGGGNGGGGDGGSSGRLPPRPLPQMPPPKPVRVPSAINDPATAAEAFRVQAGNRNPAIKAIGNRDVLLREWRDANRNNLQYNPDYINNPPPAWTDHEGNIVIDKTRVDPSSPDGVPRGPAPLAPAATVPTPATTGASPATATPTGGPASGGEPPPVREGDRAPAAVGAGGGGSGPAGGGVGGGGGAGGGGGGNPPRPLPQMPPRQQRPAVHEVINDPARAAEIFRQQARVGNPVRRWIRNPAVLQAAWRDANQNNLQYNPDYINNPPPAWIDHEGNIVIDANRVDPSSPDGVPGTPRGGGQPPGGAPPSETEAPASKAPPGAEPGAVPPGAGRTPPDMAKLAALDNEARLLLRGEGVAPIPAAGAEMTRSNAEVELARRILRDPKASPENIRQAIEVIVERSVAGYRASRLAQQHSKGDFQGKEPKLTTENLHLCCGQGRDVTTDSIIALVGDSPHQVVIERVQINNLGIDEQHAFSIVTLPDGAKMLVDPTAVQFPEIARTAMGRELIRSGMVPLDGPTALQYVLAMGATPETAQAAAQRLVAGDANVLTEIVQNGEVHRTSERAAEASNTIFGVHGEDATSHAEIRDLLARMPPEHPNRPILESLARNLERLAEYQPALPDVDLPEDFITDIPGVPEEANVPEGAGSR